MCAIGGFISKTARPAQEETLREMGRLVAHRGPDGEGVWCEGALGLCHRRLAIIDLSDEAGQPMRRGDLTIVFNGEIYNYRELRAELAYPFETEGDTEVILAAYQKWGEDCVNHLAGMWAFALYDAAKQTLFCSRDRFGIKPFYYRETAEGFAFASEIKQFTCLPGWQAIANEARLRDFVLFEQLDHTAETLFEGVYQLPAGCNLTYDLGAHTHTINRYYDLDAATAQPVAESFEEACAGLLLRLEEATSRHLRADVPVGSCLSGGLDSSTIVCLIQRLLGGEGHQLTVSSCAKEKRYDEQEYIDALVDGLALENHKVFPTAEGLLEALDRLAWHQDEPYGSSSIFAQWSVFSEAKRKGAKVMLDGQGADEILAGYTGAYPVYLGELLRTGHPLRWLAELRTAHRQEGTAYGALLGATAQGIAPRGMKKRLRCKESLKRHGWYRVDKAGRNEALAALYPAPVKDMRRYSIGLLGATSLPKLLHYEDRDAMAFAVEARVPYLDHRVVEYVLRLPAAYKMGLGIPKRVLRGAMQGILPEKIAARRDKLGFETPEAVWMRENRETFRREFEAGLRAMGPLVDAPAAMAWFEEELARAGGPDFTIWRVLSVGRWAKAFGVSIAGTKKE